jgi:hypothetical protein
LKCGVDGVKREKRITGEAVEKGDFGSLVPPEVPLF